MATLNLKDLPERLHRKLRQRAERNRRSMAQEATQILNDALEGAEEISILDLRGLGKARWKGIDAARHVDRERRSWD
jgi:plasmid stability protein